MAKTSRRRGTVSPGKTLSRSTSGKKTRRVEVQHPTHEQVAERAYFIWLERGRPPGVDVDCWCAAEDELRHRR